jgi:hypothetical protein
VDAATSPDSTADAWPAFDAASPLDAGQSGDAGEVDTGSLPANDAGDDGGSGPRFDLGILPDDDNAKSDTGGIAGFISRTGVVPVVVSDYMSINGSFYTSQAQGFIDEALAAGVSRVSISLATGDADVSSGTQAQIAAAVTYGQQKGVTVQIRFGYEMNGNWSPSYHGGDPTIFKHTWAEVASAVHGAGGQMVWAPNIVAGGISPYDTVLPDDPSTIDVVGLDMYHFNGSATDLGLGSTEVDDALATIYPLVQQLDKPFIFSETGVSYIDSSGTWATATPEEVAEKKAWLDQLTSANLSTKYPLYRGFTWFDYNKYESSQYRDFSISQQPLEASMFSAWVVARRASLNLGK